MTTKKAKKTDLRVQLAKDVIAQIKIGKFVATTGTYLGSLGVSPAADLQEALKEQESCRVCALGSLMCSYAIAKDQVIVEDGYSPWESDALKDVFGPEQMSLIESAFERCDMYSDNLADGVFELDELAPWDDSNGVSYDVEYIAPEDSVKMDVLGEAIMDAKKAISDLQDFISTIQARKAALEKVNKRVGAAIAFGRKYKNSNNRLEAIMKNIIAHKGVFKP